MSTDPQKPNPLFVQRCKPMGEMKAVIEAREAGARAYMPPTEKYRRRGARVASFRPLARGYVFTSEHVPTGEYVKGLIGRTQRTELNTLYQQARHMALETRIQKRRKAEPPTFEIGASVQIMAGPFEKHVGVVASQRKDKVEVTLPMFGAARCSAFKLRLVNPSVTR